MDVIHYYKASCLQYINMSMPDLYKHSITIWINKWVDGWMNIYTKEKRIIYWLLHGFTGHESRLLN